MPDCARAEFTASYLQLVQEGAAALPWYTRAARPVGGHQARPDLFALLYPSRTIPVNPKFPPEVAEFVTGFLSRSGAIPEPQSPVPNTRPLPKLPPEVLSMITDYLAVEVHYLISPRLLYEMSQVRTGRDDETARRAMRDILADPGVWRRSLNSPRANGIAADGRIAWLREEVLVATMRQAGYYLRDLPDPTQLVFDWSRVTYDEAKAAERLITASQPRYDNMLQLLAVAFGVLDRPCAYTEMNRRMMLLAEQTTSKAASAIAYARRRKRGQFRPVDPRYYSYDAPHIARLEAPTREDPVATSSSRKRPRPFDSDTRP